MALVCTAYITLKNGRKLYARDYGKRAFCWEVPTEKERPTVPENE